VVGRQQWWQSAATNAGRGGGDWRWQRAAVPSPEQGKTEQIEQTEETRQNGGRPPAAAATSSGSNGRANNGRPSAVARCSERREKRRRRERGRGHTGMGGREAGDRFSLIFLLFVASPILGKFCLFCFLTLA